MNGFERRTQLKRLNIIEAALKLFMRYGVKKVTVAEIAKQAKVSQVTLFKYFDNKENLTRHVLAHVYEMELNDFIEVIEKELPFEQKLKMALFDLGKRYQAAGEHFWVDVLSEPLHDVRVEFEQKLLPHMFRFIDMGKESGFFDPRYSRETLLFYMRSFSAQAGKHMESMEDKKQIYNELLYIFLNGVSGQSKGSVIDL